MHERRLIAQAVLALDILRLLIFDEVELARLTVLATFGRLLFTYSCINLIRSSSFFLTTRANHAPWHSFSASLLAACTSALQTNLLALRPSTVTMATAHRCNGKTRHPLHEEAPTTQRRLPISSPCNQNCRFDYGSGLRVQG